MPAYMPGLGAAGTKLVTVHPGNKQAHDLPAVIARIVLNSPENGLPLAIMDGTYVTANPRHEPGDPTHPGVDREHGN